MKEMAKERLCYAIITTVAIALSSIAVAQELPPEGPGSGVAKCKCGHSNFGTECTEGLDCDALQWDCWPMQTGMCDFDWEEEQDLRWVKCWCTDGEEEFPMMLDCGVGILACLVH
jgi:hypothetical protein